MKKIHDFYFPDWDSHFHTYFSKSIGYQEAQRNRALSKVKNFGVAVDCGAHVGLWSRDLSNYFEKLYCFEPVKEFFDCLKLNIKKDNVKFYNSALGKKKTKGKILVTKNSGNSGNSKVLNERKLYNSDIDFIQDIEIIALDSLELNQLDFFKIDVEGLGLDVLEGSINILEKSNPVVCLELFEIEEKKDQIKLLNNLGYELVDKIIKEHIFIKKKP